MPSKGELRAQVRERSAADPSFLQQWAAAHGNASPRGASKGKLNWALNGFKAAGAERASRGAGGGHVHDVPREGGGPVAVRRPPAPRRTLDKEPQEAAAPAPAAGSQQRALCEFLPPRAMRSPPKRLSPRSGMASSPLWSSSRPSKCHQGKDAPGQELASELAALKLLYEDVVARLTETERARAQAEAALATQKEQSDATWRRMQKHNESLLARLKKREEQLRRHNCRPSDKPAKKQECKAPTGATQRGQMGVCANRFQAVLRRAATAERTLHCLSEDCVRSAVEGEEKDERQRVAQCWAAIGEEDPQSAFSDRCGSLSPLPSSLLSPQRAEAAAKVEALEGKADALRADLEVSERVVTAQEGVIRGLGGELAAAVHRCRNMSEACAAAQVRTLHAEQLLLPRQEAAMRSKVMREEEEERADFIRANSSLGCSTATAPAATEHVCRSCDEVLFIDNVCYWIAAFSPKAWAPVCIKSARFVLGIMNSSVVRWKQVRQDLGQLQSMGQANPSDHQYLGPEAGLIYLHYHELYNLKNTLWTLAYAGSVYEACVRWFNRWLLHLDMVMNAYEELRLKHKALYIYATHAVDDHQGVIYTLYNVLEKHDNDATPAAEASGEGA